MDLFSRLWQIIKLGVGVSLAFGSLWLAKTVEIWTLSNNFELIIALCLTLNLAAGIMLIDSSIKRE